MLVRLKILLGVVNGMHLVSAHTFLIYGLREELYLGVQPVLILKLARRKSTFLSFGFAALAKLVDDLLSLLLQRRYLHVNTFLLIWNLF